MSDHRAVAERRHEEGLDRVHAVLRFVEHFRVLRLEHFVRDLKRSAFLRDLGVEIMERRKAMQEHELAVDVAGRFGVAPDRAVRYENDPEGVNLNYEVMSDVISYARSAGSPKEMSRRLNDAKPLGRIREDYKKRHKK